MPPNVAHDEEPDDVSDFAAPGPLVVPVDLSQFRVTELLRLEAEVIKELRHRGLVRTNNKPLADVAEQIVFHARGGVLEPNSTKSHDITTGAGVRIQVKAMGHRSAGTAAKFSVIRSADYDLAVFLVFDPVTFGVAKAYEVTADAIEKSVAFIPHVNGRAPSLRQVQHLGVEVTTEMRRAYRVVEYLNALPPDGGVRARQGD